MDSSSNFRETGPGGLDPSDKHLRTMNSLVVELAHISLSGIN
jgi:hypothetical protein